MSEDYRDRSARSSLTPESVRAAVVAAARHRDTKSVARELSRRGVSVFPCNGKVPAIAGGFTAASADVALAVARWQGRRAEAWVGLPTGLDLQGGRVLAVLDIDPRHGGTLDARLPATLTVRTKSGGVHLYFAAQDRKLRSSAGVLAPGVDVRAGGGYVIAPGSPGYTVLVDRGIAPLPGWVHNQLVPHARARRQRRASATGPAVRLGESIGEGGRNSGLASVAGQLLIRGCTDDLASTLAKYNEDYCQPPLDEREVERIAASILRSAARAGAVQ